MRGFLTNLPIPEPILAAIVTGVALCYLVPLNLIPHPTG